MHDRIEEQVWQYLNRIDEMGGMVQAILHGFVQKEIQDSAYRYQREIEHGERVVVGVNRFAVKNEKPPEILRVNPQLRKLQSKKIATLKEKRNDAAVQRALKALQQAAGQPQVNLMPLIIKAAEVDATLGEIINILREEFGEYQESIVI